MGAPHPCAKPAGPARSGRSALVDPPDISSPFPTHQILFVISKPDVYKSPASDTHVIFGEAKIEDLGAQQQGMGQEQFKAQDMAGMMASMGAAGAPAAASRPAPVEEEDASGPVDESGVDPKDIELVMTQAGVGRSKAISALRQSNGDIVSAIMELTL